MSCPVRIEPKNADGDIGNAADDVHQRLHHAGEKLRFPVRVINCGAERINFVCPFRARGGSYT